VLITAFGKRSKRIKSQALVEFEIGEELFEGVFLISPQLINSAIIGCQFLKEYGITINFERESISYSRDGSIKEHRFSQQPGCQEVRSDDRTSGRNPVCPPSPGQKPFTQSADSNSPTPSTVGQYSCEVHTPRPVGAQSYSPHPRQTVEAGSGVSVERRSVNRSSGFEDDEASQSVVNDLVNEVEFIEDDCSNFRGAASVLRNCNERDVMSKGHESHNEVKDKEVYVSYAERKLPSRTHIPETQPDFLDPRSLQKTDLSDLIEQNANLCRSKKKS
jgi:hypothetical protein